MAGFLVVACTADEPGPKKCEVGTSDPDLECVGGYTCECKPEGCICVASSKAQPLTQPGPDEDDPNRLFLRRLGVIQGSN